MSPLTRPLIVLVLAAFVVPSFIVTGSPDDPAPLCIPMYVDGVGDACRLPDGLYQVTLPDGHTFTTHGPDPKTDDADETLAPLAEREPRCASDYYQHVLYGRPASQSDRFASSEATIRSSIRSMNALLNQDALASGGVNADYKVLCGADGRFRIDSFVVASNTVDFSGIVQAARNAGFADPRADYTIFYDASHSAYCGVGHYSADDRLVANNANNFGSDYGVTYRGCWSGRTPMHENGHNQGAVQTLAPDSDLQGHCLEGRDVMCYPTSSFLVLCGSRVFFDCDHDTYFDAQSEPGEWLHTHWNIGSRLNRFIAFSDTDPPPTNNAPYATFTYTTDGRTITADATASSDLDGDALSHQWHFGDGATATGAIVTHTYAAAGTYTIILNVTDARGASTEATQSVSFPHDIPPSVVLHRIDSRLQCGVAYRPVMTRDLCDPDGAGNITIPMAPGVTGARVVLTWDENPVAGAREMTYAWVRPGGLGSASGASPVQGDHVVETGSASHLEGVDAVIDVRASGTSGLVIDQPFTLCVAVLYGGAAAPADLSCSG